MFPDDVKLVELNNKFQQFVNDQGNDGKADGGNDDKGDGGRDDEQDNADGGQGDHPKDNADEQDNADHAAPGEDAGLDDNDWLNDPGLQEVLDNIEKNMSKSKPHRSNLDLTPPRFSLLSQDYSTPPPKSNTRLVPPLSAASAVVHRGKRMASKEAYAVVHRGKCVASKRVVKPSKYFCSPYKLRETDISTPLCPFEFQLSGSVFIMKREVG